MAVHFHIICKSQEVFFFFVKIINKKISREIELQFEVSATNQKSVCEEITTIWAQIITVGEREKGEKKLINWPLAGSAWRRERAEQAHNWHKGPGPPQTRAPSCRRVEWPGWRRGHARASGGDWQAGFIHNPRPLSALHAPVPHDFHVVIVWTRYGVPLLS